MSIFYAVLMSRMKAIVAFFLSGLATLIIQSIEQGGGFNIPKSTEDWIMSLVTALIVAIGVERTTNKPMPTDVGGK